MFSLRKKRILVHSKPDKPRAKLGWLCVLPAAGPTISSLYFVCEAGCLAMSCCKPRSEPSRYCHFALGKRSRMSGGVKFSFYRSETLFATKGYQVKVVKARSLHENLGSNPDHCGPPLWV